MSEMPKQCAGPPPEVQERPGFKVEQCCCDRDGTFKSKDDHRYCIFHLPTEDKKRLGGLSKEFGQAFRDEAKKERPWFTEFSGMVFFAGFRFPFGFGITIGTSKVLRGEETEDNREAAKPGPRKRLSYLKKRLKSSSRPAEFEFKWCIFEDGADFSQVKFGKRVSFEGAKFQGSSKFRFASFGSRANFQNTHFLGKADFRQISFGVNLTFDNSIFSKEAL
ncbi:MAG: pentapeptide repeat-containing protein [Proteobacteria bacterium]|nr:pentapeptide repeat-containing protein [Pseudomonadota bacterium]MBU1742421.1 pentapeptide repeat-containing protein [Pseudomonadota bacterium]